MEESLSRIQRRNPQKIDLQQTYTKLNTFIQNVNEKIINRIQLVQQAYLEEYKNQVQEMTEELKTIRGVLDQQLLRQRSNERLFFLQEERDFFRGQTMKLNEEVTSLNRANTLLKAQLEQANSEAANFKQLVYGLQKKIVTVRNDAYQVEKLTSLKMPSIAPQKSKEMISTISPTKTTLTRYSPLIAQPQNRTVYRSVELKKNQGRQQLSSEVKRREQILQQCIKDIKKKIFYRTLSEKQPTKLFFNQSKQILFQKFTRTDKQQLIRSILNRDEVLSQFYNFMMGRREVEKVSPRKYGNSKSTFSDKIFKIKLCGLNSLS